MERLNKYLLLVALLVVVGVGLAFILGSHSKRENKPVVAVENPNEKVEELCDNAEDIEDFIEPIQISWEAEFTGCLVSCHGAHFTRLPSEREYEYPRFSGYYFGEGDKENLELEKHVGGTIIPEKFRKHDGVLRIHGKWIAVDADYPYTVFNDMCVPIVHIDTIEIIDSN